MNLEGLCSRCQNFDIQAFQRNDYPFRGYPLQAVIHAAISENCGFCSLLSSHLEILHPIELRAAIRRETRSSLDGNNIQRIWYERIDPFLSRYVFRTTWVHFCVERAENLAEAELTSLRIKKIYAFVARGPADSKEYCLPSDLDLRVTPDLGNEEVKMSRIDFNVAADEGEYQVSCACDN